MSSIYDPAQQGMRTVKGPSGSEAFRLSSSLIDDDAPTVLISIAGKQGAPAVSVNLSPTQARVHAESVLRLVNEPVIASFIPWNVGSDMREAANQRIIDYAARLVAERSARDDENPSHSTNKRKGRKWPQLFRSRP